MIKKPKGKLLIIGGAEDKGENDFLDYAKKNKRFRRYEILKEVLKHSKNKKIEIITTASDFPDEVRKLYQDAFHKIHYPNPGFMSIRHHDEVDREEYLKRMKVAGAVFFTGGDQRRLARIFQHSKLLNIIKQKYLEEKDFLIAGTSAGAMAMSTVMIAGGGKYEALFNDDLELQDGLGILENCIIDTHFIKRGRFARLAHAIILHPKQLGIGLGEDTALIIKNGANAECRGSGMVVIIDGRYITLSNIKRAKSDDPIYVNNLKVHLLIRDCSFSMRKRKLYRLVGRKKTTRGVKKKK